MRIVRWEATSVARPVDPLALDELDGAVLVLDGATAAHDPMLGWVRRAPCLVVGRTPSGAPTPNAVDVALRDVDDALEVEVMDRVRANPHAARSLVEVLRVLPSLDVPAGLLLESYAYSVLLAGPEHQRWLTDRAPVATRTFGSGPVRVERDGDVLRVALTRPENRNAFSAAVRDALFEALTSAEVDATVERVVLSGDGPVFSSGGDLAEFGTAPDVVRAHQVRTARSIGAQLHRLTPHVEVRVQGGCVGAGVELAAFADHVVAASSATFRLPEVSMGLIPGAGGTVSISRRIGRQRTALLALLDRPMDATEARRTGLVDEISDAAPR